MDILVTKTILDWVRHYQHLNKASASFIQFVYAAEEV
jgi:hypothetical protein